MSVSYFDGESGQVKENGQLPKKASLQQLSIGHYRADGLTWRRWYLCSWHCQITISWTFNDLFI